ncbi:MAG: hypothetical protein KKF80_06365, partial [Candidatus Omnitrophica bacterium]|nr:hypothetical protein [Candidatus Omnitrophota bacterium]
MSLKKIFLIVVGLGISLSVHAEVIKFKNGKTVEGDITERDATSIKVDTSGIALTYYLDEIDSIDGKRIDVSSAPVTEG